LGWPLKWNLRLVQRPRLSEFSCLLPCCRSRFQIPLRREKMVELVLISVCG
jgi:hypothetical protein